MLVAKRLLNVVRRQNICGCAVRAISTLSSRSAFATLQRPAFAVGASRQLRLGISFFPCSFLCVFVFLFLAVPHDKSMTFSRIIIAGSQQRSFSSKLVKFNLADIGEGIAEVEIIQVCEGHSLAPYVLPPS